MCHNSECWIVGFKNKSRIAHIQCDLRETLYGISAKYTFYYKYSNVYRKFIIDVEENVCHLLAKKDLSKYPILSAVYPYFFNTSFTHPCPYKNGTLYANIDVSKMNVKNAMLPTGQYRIHLTMFKKGKGTPKKAFFFMKIYTTVPAGKSIDEFSLTG